MIGFFLIAWGLTYFITRGSFISSLRVALLRELVDSKKAYDSAPDDRAGSAIWVSARLAFWAWASVLIYCGGCVGFWVGLALGLAGAWPEPPLLGWGPFVDAAVASMGVNAIISEFVGSPHEHEAAIAGLTFEDKETQHE